MSAAEEKRPYVRREFVRTPTRSPDSPDLRRTRRNVKIYEYFLGFLPVESSTGMNLSDILIQRLRDLDILIQNMRGQGYDNGANMKGKHSGVQRRIRIINPRDFFNSL